MIIFQEDFTKPNFGWFACQEVAPDRLVAQNVITRIPDESALEITVKPGDNPIHSTGERNELLQMIDKFNDDVTSATGLDHIATSFLVPDAWQDAAGVNPWCAVLQLHGPNIVPSNQGSPSFEVDILGGQFVLNTRGGDTSDVIRHTTNLGAYIKGVWSDFLFKILWGITANAYIEVYRRDNKQGDLTLVAKLDAPNLYSASGKTLPGYVKSGLYRSAQTFTQTLYRGKIVRATTFEEAAYFAFEGQGI